MPSSSNWVKLTNGLEARVRANQPEIANDQGWSTEIELRNTSQIPVYVGGNMPDVFSPEIRSKATRELMRSGDKDGGNRKEHRYYFQLQPGSKSSVAYSERPFSRPYTYNYCFYGHTWKLSPGEYIFGGKLRLETFTTERSKHVVTEAVFPELMLKIWRQQSDEELKLRIGEVWREFGNDRPLAWSKVAEMARPGMQRRQVEMILPLTPVGFLSRTSSGGSQSVLYPVDVDLTVGAIYDYTGGPARLDDKGNPEDRLLERVEVRHGK